MFDNYLEDEFKEPYTTWKANPSPAANASILTTLHPVLTKGINTYVGEPNPLLTSKARALTLQGLRSYDPSKSRLQTHLMNQYRGLQRASRQQSEVMRVPERLLYNHQQLHRYTDELTHELGREPTDRELVDRTGFSLDRIRQVRRYNPGVSEGQLEDIDPSLTSSLIQADPRAQNAWVQLIYEDLPPLDQSIMELSLGLNGRKRLSNQEIAQRLKRSPGAISQRKARIQQLLDQEQELSPFLGDQ